MAKKNVKVNMKDLRDNFKDMRKRLEKSLKSGKRVVFTSKEMDKFEKYYAEIMDTNVDEIGEDDIKQLQKAIAVAKSFYESDKADKNIFTDEMYDNMLSVIKVRGIKNEDGDVEPMPAEKEKGLTKVKPIDEYLVNHNMQRGYKIKENESLPDSVKEKNSVEAFLKNLYEKMGYEKSEKVRLRMTPKIDGCALVFSVKDGEITECTQKGDKDGSVSVKGFIGEKYEAEDGNYQVEAFVPKSVMKNLKKEDGSEYSSSRSCTAGLINRAANGAKDLFQYLRFYPIAKGGVKKDHEKAFRSYYSQLAKNVRDVKLHSYRIVGGEFKYLLQQVKEYYDYLSENRGKLDYDVDGVVICAMDDDVIKTVGRKDRANEYDFALKFQSATNIVKINEYTMSVGEKGKRPVKAKFDPITIGGREYKECLVDTRYYNDGGLRVGDEFTLSITGDAIPKLSRSLNPDQIVKGDGEEIIIESCHVCGKKFDKEGAEFICKNEFCKGNIVARVLNSLKVLKVKNVGEASAMKIVETYMIQSPDDILRWLREASFDNVKQLGALGESIMEAYENMRENGIELKDVILAAGIRRIGEETATKIADCVGNDSYLAFMKADEEELYKLLIKGRRNNSYSFTDESAKYFASQMKEAAYYIPMRHLIASFKINHKATEFTVGSTGYRPTPIMEKLIELAGGRVTEGKSFDILLGSKDSKSSKAEKAKKYDLPIMDEEQICKEMFGKILNMPKYRDSIKEISGDEDVDQVIEKACSVGSESFLKAITDILGKK